MYYMIVLYVSTTTKANMLRVALQMLIGDTAKYLGLVLGIAFSTLLIAQQASIFYGAMIQTTHAIVDVPGIDVWVMRQTIDTPEDGDPLPESAVKRVASVSGVEFAAPYYKAVGNLRTNEGKRRSVMIIGLDDATLLGAPPRMEMGQTSDLRQQDGVILDLAAFSKIFPGQPLALGGTFEVGGRRGMVVGICRASPPFSGADIMYAKRSLAVEMAKEADNTVSFVLVRTKFPADAPSVASAIEQQTRLRAYSTADFKRATILWNLRHSGIAEVLGAAIMLGLIVGMVVVGQTFYMFSIENAKQFATLKAMGLSNLSVLGMMFSQAAFVAVVGYGLGIGATVLFFKLMADDTSPLRGMMIEPTVLLGSAVVVVGMTIFAAMLSAKRVLTIEPAIVFKGG